MSDEHLPLLTEIGVDIPLAEERFMNNDALYMRFLLKFADNEQIGELKEFLQANDWNESLMTSHNLKSLTGNLSLMKLHELFSEQVRLLREKDNDAAVSIMDDIMEEYTRIQSLLRNVQA